MQKAAAFLGAAFAVGVGAIGPALGQGFVGMKACENVGKYPDSAGQIRTNYDDCHGSGRNSSNLFNVSCRCINLDG